MVIDPTISTLNRLARSRQGPAQQPLAEIQRAPMPDDDPTMFYDMRNVVPAPPRRAEPRPMSRAIPTPYRAHPPTPAADRTQALTPMPQDQPNQGRGTLGELAALPTNDGPTLGLIREFEGFRETPYWDVNAYRTGYGSDTITRPDGSVVKVRRGMRVSEQDAERDLARRAQDFADTARGQIGAEVWGTLSPNQRASLTSITYNYGSLPSSVVSAFRTRGDVAQAIRALSRHNKGINADRRMREAAIFAAG